ncbi:MAG: PilZ domain-containing protein, partial [Deltaproteobacteria bacterium]
QFTRAPYVTLARLQVEGAAGAVIARLDDVSEGGLRARVEVEITVGTSVVLLFALPITGETWSAHCVVRWAVVHGPHHVLGLAFEDLDPQTRQVLVRYVTVMSAFGP